MFDPKRIAFEGVMQRLAGRLTFNSIERLPVAVLAGFGLAYLPEDMVRPTSTLVACARSPATGVRCSWLPPLLPEPAPAVDSLSQKQSMPIGPPADKPLKNGLR